MPLNPLVEVDPHFPTGFLHRLGFCLSRTAEVLEKGAPPASLFRADPVSWAAAEQKPPLHHSSCRCRGNLLHCLLVQPRWPHHGQANWEPGRCQVWGRNEGKPKASWRGREAKVSLMHPHYFFWGGEDRGFVGLGHHCNLGLHYHLQAEE